MQIIPETAQDHAFLELNYNIKEWNDTITGIYRPNSDVFLKNAIEFKRITKEE